MLYLSVAERKSEGDQDNTGPHLLFVGTAQLCVVGQSLATYTLNGITDLQGAGFSPGLRRVRGPDGLRFADEFHGVKRAGTLLMAGPFYKDYNSGDIDSHFPTQFTMTKSDMRGFVEACRTVGADPQ